MKTMTCNQLGGPCDAAMTANTPEELVSKAMEHVKMAHPEMAAEIEKMSDADSKVWMEEFKKKWEATPETKQA